MTMQKLSFFLFQESTGRHIYTDREFTSVQEAELFADAIILDLNEVFDEENFWTATIEEV